MARPPKPLSTRGSRPPPWSPAASRDEVRSYLLERMKLLSKLLFWIFWLLVGFVFALYWLYPETRPARVGVVHDLALVGLAVLGAIWYYALHRRELSIEGLYVIDVFYAVAIGIIFGLSAYYSSDKTANVYSAFIWQTFAVFTRVLVVPSTGRRTAVVSSVSYLPLVLAASLVGIQHPEHLDLPPPATLVGTAIFAGVAVLLATTGSRVIYGLRRQVREAVRLGQYTLGEKLGEGGMGSVYKATHAMLRRPTAIKLLPVDRFGTDSIARFEREVQLTSRLSHPNTIAIFDYGRSPDGVFYYAMEYLDGIDLEALVRTFGPLPSDRVVAIIRQVCGALAEAHAAGLIHRDVKPGNVLLCQRGGKPDVAKVVDFGLVEELDPEGPASELVGTPAYLAPEAIADGTVGPAADLYALGAVGYYLLSSHRVFDGASFVELCVQHTSKQPQPPSQRTSNDIPTALEAIVMKCLAKDPGQRFGSADELDAALAALAPTGNWSTAHALEWWRAFDQVRTKVRSEVDPEALTVSVDLTERLSGRPGAAQARDTGQAT